MPPNAPARPTSGNGTISRLRGASYNLKENEADSQYESWKVEETSTGTLVRIRGKAYTLSNTFAEVVEAIEAIRSMYSDLPAEFDCMVEAYLLELCQNEAVRAKEHDEQGGGYTFIVERDAEISRNNALRLALREAEQADSVSEAGRVRGSKRVQRSPPRGCNSEHNAKKVAWRTTSRQAVPRAGPALTQRHAMQLPIEG